MTPSKEAMELTRHIWSDADLTVNEIADNIQNLIDHNTAERRRVIGRLRDVLAECREFLDAEMPMGKVYKANNDFYMRVCKALSETDIKPVGE